jgi:hypothetical protein
VAVSVATLTNNNSLYLLTSKTTTFFNISWRKTEKLLVYESYEYLFITVVQELTRMITEAIILHIYKTVSSNCMFEEIGSLWGLRLKSSIYSVAYNSRWNVPITFIFISFSVAGSAIIHCYRCFEWRISFAFSTVSSVGETMYQVDTSRGYHNNPQGVWGWGD